MLSLMITLCMYAQQDYAFGIVCVYVAKKLAVEVLPIENLSLVQATASLLCQTIRSEKEIRKHSINRMGKRFPENCISVSHALSMCNAASYAMLLQLQCRPTILLQV